MAMSPMAARADLLRWLVQGHAAGHAPAHAGDARKPLARGANERCEVR